MACQRAIQRQQLLCPHLACWHDRKVILESCRLLPAARTLQVAHASSSSALGLQADSRPGAGGAAHMPPASWRTLPMLWRPSMTATCLEAMLKVHHPYPHSPAHLPWPSQLSPGRTGLTGAAISRSSFTTRAHAPLLHGSRREEGYLRAARRWLVLQRLAHAHDTQGQPLRAF